jgi:3-dehydroquinate synthase
MIMVKLLDCTLRDGGYVNDWKFTDEQVSNCYSACSEAGIDFIEIGFRNRRTESNLRKYGSTFFCTEEFVNKVVKQDGTQVAVMVTINEFDIADFVPASQSKIKLVRILMAYHGGKNGDDNILDIKQLTDGITQIQMLVDLGYKVSFNLGRIDKLSKDQLKEVCFLLKQTSISYFAMADTYGSVTLDTIEELVPYVRSLLPPTISIGFHAHDNCSNGTAKALHSLKFGADIIDGCVLGFGRGSGNAKTELLIMETKRYNILPILRFGDKHIVSYKNCVGITSYNIVYALASYFGCHVSYAIDIIEKYEKLDIGDIFTTFQYMKDKKIHNFYNERRFMEIHKLLHQFSVDGTVLSLNSSDIVSNSITVQSYSKSYDVHYVTKSLPELLVDIYSEGDFVLVDKNVNRGIAYDYEVTAIESNKTLETVMDVFDKLSELKFTKKNKVIVIGGGITQDIGGFVASIFKRGIDWVFIPTTLLSMADSAIGGKVGINRSSKNVIGAFSAPNQVYISDWFLSTLSSDDIVSGLGECLKMAIIGGNHTYSLFKEKYDQNDILGIIKLTSGIKKPIIERDELEKNIRKVLNYGHTFGHALEGASNHMIPHGIAVLLGMYMENEVFTDNNIAVNSTIFNMIPDRFKSLRIDYSEFVRHLQADKKNLGTKLCCVIFDRLGESRFEYMELAAIEQKINRTFHALFGEVTVCP